MAHYIPKESCFLKKTNTLLAHTPTPPSNMSPKDANFLLPYSCATSNPNHIKYGDVCMHVFKFVGRKLILMKQKVY